MITHLSDDAKAILLLCSSLERNPVYTPRTQKEYTTLVRWLVKHDMPPARLFESGSRLPVSPRKTTGPSHNLSLYRLRLAEGGLFL